MKVNVRGSILLKTGFVVISIFIAFAVAFSADSSVKQPSMQGVAKSDPGEWKKVVEAAKKEGKIVISGAPGEGWRKSLVDMFQQEYPEITVEFTAASGRTFGARVRQEREVGQKLWDLRSGGADTAMEAKKNGFLSPIRPLLLPEIADDKKWIGGIDGIFNDRENKYILGYTLYIEPSSYVNRDFIKESDLKSSAQLLDQKFKGKIVILTPTAGSTQQSLGNMAFMYGVNFIRELLSRQDVIVTDDNRQQVEWVVRGKYPIAIGFSKTLLIPFEKQGVGKNVVELEDKIIRLTTGSGNICLLEGAPHPNAAKVYINWLLSQKTQILLSKNVEHNSSRTDVPPVEAAIDPAKLNKYRISSLEENSEFDGSLLPVIKEALKK